MVYNYLVYVTRELNQNSAEINSIYTLQYTPQKTLSYIKLIAKDYGVIQVGVSIINNWMTQLFTEPDNGVLVEAIIAHPISNIVSGALIQWDHVNDSPIIYELEL
jgi:hypothetical protein